MTEKEKRTFIEKLRMLPEKKKTEFYYMVIGAAFAARETGKGRLNCR